MKLMEMMEPSADYINVLIKKLAPPLVTLLSAEPEIQYVALRNINLIVQKRSVPLSPPKYKLKRKLSTLSCYAGGGGGVGALFRIISNANHLQNRVFFAPKY